MVAKSKASQEKKYRRKMMAVVKYARRRMEPDAQRLIRQVGKNLRRARKNAGVTQRSLAKIAGLAQCQISRIENGYGGNLKIRTILVLEFALGIEPGSLLGELNERADAVSKSDEGGPDHTG